jgi:hypothetical protein
MVASTAIIRDNSSCKIKSLFKTLSCSKLTLFFHQILLHKVCRVDFIVTAEKDKQFERSVFV